LEEQEVRAVFCHCVDDLEGNILLFWVQVFHARVVFVVRWLGQGVSLGT
jgi:hypothetical protein